MHRYEPYVDPSQLRHDDAGESVGFGQQPVGRQRVAIGQIMRLVDRKIKAGIQKLACQGFFSAKAMINPWLCGAQRAAQMQQLGHASHAMYHQRFFQPFGQAYLMHKHGQLHVEGGSAATVEAGLADCHDIGLCGKCVEPFEHVGIGTAGIPRVYANADMRQRVVDGVVGREADY